MTDPSTTAEPRELPPIRIHHFLAWMAVMGIMLTLSSLRQPHPTSRTPSAMQNAFVGIGVVGSVLGSLAVTIVLFGLYWRRRGLPFFTQPGQWLLVESATGLLLARVIFGLTHLLPSATDLQTRPFLRFALVMIPIAVIGIFVTAINVYIARYKVSEFQWRRVFYWKAVAPIVPLIGHLAVAVALERAVRANRRAHPLRGSFAPGARTVPVSVQYHWTHWVGVTLQFVDVALMWAIAVATAGTIAYAIANR